MNRTLYERYESGNEERSIIGNVLVTGAIAHPDGTECTARSVATAVRAEPTSRFAAMAFASANQVKGVATFASANR